MSDELREKIKELIAQGCGCDRYCKKNPEDCGCARDADAAIALARDDALEEAAKTVDALESPPGNTHSYGMYWEDGAGAAADAIRAMKGKP